jgi:hypothetical protein
MKTSKPLEFHALAGIFPAYVEWHGQDQKLLNVEDNEAWRDFVTDIRVNGQRTPITLYDGKILDGRHRYLACRELGIPVEYETFSKSNSEEKALAYSVSLNLQRRNLTVADRAAVYLSLKPWYSKFAEERKGGRGKKSSPNGDGFTEPDSAGRAQKKAAKKAGIGSGTAARVDSLPPDLLEEVLDGKRKVGNAAAEAKARKEKGTRAAARKGKIAAQQELVGEAVTRAVRALRSSLTPLADVADAMYSVKWQTLDQSQRDKLTAALSDINAAMDRIPWPEEEEK